MTTAVKRSAGRALVVVGLLTARVPDRLTAQVSLSASLGARYTSTLVHDSIVAPFDVRAGLAPTVAATLGLPLNDPWRLEIVLDLATSGVRRHESDGSSAPITHLTTLGLGLGLRRQLHPWLAARLGGGLLKYLPSASVGLFQDGAGGLMPYGQFVFVVAPTPAARRHLALEVQGDLHRLQTAALRTEGFVDARVVYRAAVLVRADLWRRR